MGTNQTKTKKKTAPKPKAESPLERHARMLAEFKSQGVDVMNSTKKS